MFGRRLGFAAHALRGDEFNIVAFAHVCECIVSGQDFTLGGRYGIKGSLRIAVQFFQLHLIVAQTLLIVGFAFRIGLNQRIGNVLRISTHQDGVGPNVRVKFAVIVMMAFMIVVMMMAALFCFQSLNAFGRFGERHFALFDCALYIGGFQAQAVEQYQFGTADFFDVATGHVVGMAVLVGAHQALNGHTVATNLFGHVAQNAEAGDNRQRSGISCTGQ